MINDILFYNKMVHDFGIPWGMLTIGERREAIDRNCIFLILNVFVLFKIQPVQFYGTTTNPCV